MRVTKAGLTAGVLVIMAGVILTAKSFYQRRAEEGVSQANAKVLEVPGAKVRVVEYTDFQCPACAGGARALRGFLEAHPGMVSVEYRYYPLSEIHAHALRAAMYAECASRQGQFWAYHDQLFLRQKEWARAENAEPVFQRLAKETGLDMTRLNACVADERTKLAVQLEKAGGLMKGVRATPTYFVNGQMQVGAKAMLSALGELLDIPSPGPEKAEPTD